jgi:hypothetical protein
MLVRPQRKMKKITPVFQHIGHHNDWFLFLLSEEHKVLVKPFMQGRGRYLLHLEDVDAELST